MLKQHWRIVSRLERICDNVLIVGAFFTTYYCRAAALELAGRVISIKTAELQPLASIESYFIVLGFALPLYNAAISILGGYRRMRFSTAVELGRLSTFSSLLVFLCIGSLLYLFKLELSRSFVGIFCAFSGSAIFVERFVGLALLRYWRLRGKNFRNILIVGTGAQAQKIYREISRQPELGVRVVGFAAVPDASGEMPPGRLAVGTNSRALELLEHPDQLSIVELGRVVADAAGFEMALKRFAVDEVLFTDVIKSYATVQELARIAVEEGVRVTLAADLFSLEIFKSDMSYFGNVPLIHYQPSPGEPTALALKRVIDVIAALAALVLLSPLMLAVAVLIKLDSPGPVFFKQRRVGLNGRLFTLLKFRSMVVDAENLLEDLRERNEMTGPVFKVKNDPRITRIGRFIRRFSVDEFPQFINVLKGDMSLVGPRPPIPEEVSLYERKQRRRLSMRPGLTCIWQVAGRNNIPDFERWAQLDLEYIDRWSIGLDFKLMLKTIPVVLSGIGAR